MFWNSDEEPTPEFSINKKYAESYEKWREKEELQKLKDRYGNEIEDENESSETESDDLDAEDLNPELEKNFLSVLSALKSKDPSIYDKNSKYFLNKTEKNDESESESGSGSESGLDSDQKMNKTKEKVKKNHKEKPLYLKDYERKVILEKGGELPDEIDERELKNANFDDLSYADQQKHLKKSFKVDLGQNEDSFLVPRVKSDTEKKKEEDEYLEWLKGKKSDLNEKEDVQKLKYLHDYWNDPKLDPGEKFLKEYLLNKRYLGEDSEEQGENSKIPTYDEIVEPGFDEEEDILDAQEQFEHKYNFRFEEPDEEFIKSYPRTIEGTLRRKNDKNKRDREAKKERKQKQEEQKREELKRLKNLKRKEIMEKLKKLKEITGNEDLPIDPDEFERDFDPAEYDKKMKEMFDEDFYAQGDENEEKPEFSDSENETDEENLENWTPNGPQNSATTSTNVEKSSQKSDKDESRDQKSNQNESRDKESKDSSSKKRRKSKFMQAVSRPKPLFDPKEKTFEEYFDEYYKLDCEDILGGDTVCRFKYRKVQPNDFGLTTEEILKANPKELNSWVSVKKMSQYRPEKDEIYDLTAYKKKAEDFTRKQKILTSVYGHNDEEIEPQNQPESEINTGNFVLDTNKSISQNINSTGSSNSLKKKRKKKNKKRKFDEIDAKIDKNDSKMEENESKIDQNGPKIDKNESKIDNNSNFNNKKRKIDYHNPKNFDPSEKPKSRDDKKNREMKSRDQLITRLPDERLKAYGINPKKFKNKLKYEKKL